MPWFRIDDGFSTSRKVLSIPKRARLSAVGLWTLAGAWCAKELTDGVVPAFMIEELGGTQASAEALVTSTLWSREGRLFVFANWADYQPTKGEVEDARKKNAEKLRKWRDRNRVTNEDVTGLHTGYEPVTNRPVTPPPTRPDPTRPIKEEVAKATSKKGGRLPPDWIPSEKAISEIRTKFPGLDSHAEHAVFVDFWIGVPGQKGLKLDWDATWRNWMRRKGAEMIPAQRRKLTNAEIALENHKTMFGGQNDERGSIEAVDQSLGGR